MEQLETDMGNGIDAETSSNMADSQKPHNESISKEIWKKFRIYTPGKVSRIHLYEARERYDTLVLRTALFEEKLNYDRNTDNDERIALNHCVGVLKEAEKCLTRTQEDLNKAWRILTRAQVLLVMKIVPPDQINLQVDIMREEAFRLQLEEDPFVKNQIQNLTELIQDKIEDQPLCKIRRSIVALLEHYNTVRTSRIHQQYINIRTYKFAFSLLIPLAFFLIFHADAIVPETKHFQNNISEELAVGLIDALTSPILYIHNLAGYLFKTNVLAYVFVGGLAGGYFSVISRLRDKKLTPGDDAYFITYVLTKPFVGALGAVILYILFTGGLIDLFHPNDGLEKAKIFSIAFLSGFSERIAFPSYTTSSGK